MSGFSLWKQAGYSFVEKKRKHGDTDMKILVLADAESKYLWDYFDKKKLEGIDLIISCGDLAPQYLSFLATFTHAPVLYVYGNHDTCYADTPPDGCICIDDRIYVYKGIRILGLGGCMEYQYNGAPHQYTEKAMEKRVRKLGRQIRKHRGFDIMITHAPAYRINDSEDLCHTGFKCFRTMIEDYHPQYLVHGHVHSNYGRDFVRESRYLDTTIINAFEKYIIEIDETALQAVK